MARGSLIDFREAIARRLGRGSGDNSRGNPGRGRRRPPYRGAPAQITPPRGPMLPGGSARGVPITVPREEALANASNEFKRLGESLSARKIGNNSNRAEAIRRRMAGRRNRAPLAPM